MMPNDHSFFLDSSLFYPGTFCYFPGFRIVERAGSNPGKPRITDILANIGGQYTKIFVLNLLKFRK